MKLENFVSRRLFTSIMSDTSKMIRKRQFLQLFSYCAMTLSCWRLNFAHLAKSSCALTFPSSLFKRRISFFKVICSCAAFDDAVGSLLRSCHSYNNVQQEPHSRVRNINTYQVIKSRRADGIHYMHQKLQYKYQKQKRNHPALLRRRDRGRLPESTLRDAVYSVSHQRQKGHAALVTKQIVWEFEPTLSISQ